MYPDLRLSSACYVVVNKIAMRVLEKLRKELEQDGVTLEWALRAVLPNSLAHRAFTDFQEGRNGAWRVIKCVKAILKDSPRETVVYLGIAVDCLINRLIEVAGRETNIEHRTLITEAHLAHGIADNNELREL